MGTSNNILVTGGAGFIGSNFILDWFATNQPEGVINLDLLTYAGNPANLATLADNPNYTLIHGDICDADLIAQTLAQYRPQAIIHFAAESHVDRSILGPEAFLRTNIDGTFNLLRAARAYADKEAPHNFRFLHVSTDEVYGTLTPDAPAFHEETPFAPNSPYAASKASSDHLVRAWHHTYGLPTLITTCSNIYGSLQFPEKLLPLIITSTPLPRRSLSLFMETASKSATGSSSPTTVRRSAPSLANGRLLAKPITSACATSAAISRSRADDLRHPRRTPGQHLLPTATIIRTSVQDRPGHDHRYADRRPPKIMSELHWRPAGKPSKPASAKQVQWYLANPYVDRQSTPAAHTTAVDRPKRLRSAAH